MTRYFRPLSLTESSRYPDDTYISVQQAARVARSSKWMLLTAISAGLLQARSERVAGNTYNSEIKITVRFDHLKQWVLDHRVHS